MVFKDRMRHLVGIGGQSVGREGDIEVFIANRDCQTCFGICEVGCGHHGFPVGCRCYQYGGVSATPCCDSASGRYVVGVVPHGIVFRCERVGAGSGIDAYKGILLPSPAAAAIVGKNEIPEGMVFGAIAEVVIYALEGVFGGTPVERAPATFAFGLHVAVLRRLKDSA